MSKNTAANRKKLPAKAGDTGPGQSSHDKSLMRLLRAMAQCGAVLRQGGAERKVDAQEGAGQGYVVEYRASTGAARQLLPQAGLVLQCMRCELLQPVDGGWTLSPVGRLTLKRMLAGADPFLQQHQERRVERRREVGEARRVVVNDKASPLGWLARRKDANGRPLITSTQFAAGERLARDFEFGGLTPRITASWNAAATSSGKGRKSGGATAAAFSDERLAAQQRVRRALAGVGGDLADILLDVCCFQIGLARAESDRKWPRRSGKVILQIALDRLADHYGMGQARATPPIHQRLTHWGAEGYRPSIDGE